MIAIAMSLMLAGEAGPPPYPQALACAALTRAWSDLEVANNSPGAVQARDDAEFWAFAAMDAARRDGVAAQVAEADQTRAATAAKSRFTLGDQNAARELLDCQLMIPAKAAGT